MKKRLLAILLAPALVVSLMPVGVLAAPSEGNPSNDYTYATSTEVTKYPAGFFVINPNLVKSEDLEQGEGYPVGYYFPNNGDTVTLGTDTNHKVDNTTGYIGYVTETGKEYYDEQGTDRVVIDGTNFVKGTHYIMPQDFGQIKELYGEDAVIVPYQINNHTLGDNWPNVTEKDKNGHYPSSNAIHVDCYIKNVKVNVIYDANYENGGQYIHEDGATTGKSYTVLGNDGSGEDQNFKREGYTFTGWNTQANGKGTEYKANDTINPVTSGIVLYAQWTKIPTYEVDYSWSGLPEGDDTKLYNEAGDEVTPTLPEGATNLEEGDNYTVDSTYGENYTLYTKDVYGNNNASYTFSGWTSAKDANNEEVTISNGALTMPASNVTITGTWTYQSQTVTPHNVSYQWTGFPEDAADLPQLPQSGTYFNNQTVTITDEYTTHKIGHDTYTFQSWSSADATITGNSFTMPDKDVTVTGTWAKTGSDPTYTVTYNAGEDAPATYSTLPTQQRYYENDTVTVAEGLTTDETTKDGVPGTWKFSGWTSEDVEIADGTFTMPAEHVTLTGEWKFTPDEDAYTIKIQPADIGIYTGGDGYEYVVDGNAVQADENTGLPEPGYYITLPDWLNNKLQGEDGKAVDLSSQLTFSYGDKGTTGYREWKLERYDRDGNSTAYGNFVYRLLPAIDGQENVRLQFYNDTETIVSDQFTPTPGALNQEYSMTIYGGAVETGAVKAKITVDGEVVEFTTEIEPGTLTIRGVTESVDTVELNGEASDDSGFAAEVQEGTTYTINGSSIGLNDTSGVQLLVDELVEAEDPETTEAIYNALTEKALETIGSTLTSEVQADFAYMNLVDTNNGHVYVTPSNDVTVTWPYPAGTDSGDKFYVVHFTSMHRGENLAEGTIASAATDLLEVETTEKGIQFSVGSGGFSPFVLVYETPETAVTVDKSASEWRPEVGDRVKYTLVVRNTGNTTTDITVSDTLWKAGTVIILDDPDHTRVELTGNSHTFFGVPAGASITITYYYTPTWRDVGRLVNEATVTAGEVTDSDTATVIVDDGWTPNIPDDDDEDVEPEVEYTPNWLNTDDHFAYIVGYEDGSVRPTANITRAEVATIFFRLLTDEARAEFWSSENDFTDVASDAWYNNAVSTLSGMGILGGYEDGSFRPNASITRAEFVAIATRFFEYSARYEGGFTDVSYGDWYADCVQASADMGLVNGYEDGSFRPNASITRAEACAIVNRVLHRIPHEDHLLSESVMNVWPDNPKSAWYYADMQEATNSHDYDWTRESGSVVEDWTDKLPERDWSALETEWANAYSK